MSTIAVQYASKASGVYREIIDASSSPILTQNTNVVVVLQSKQGDIMRPMLVRDADQLLTMFGKRDAKLEAKGNYGLLLAEMLLQQGPIWILNIKNINANLETVQQQTLPCNSEDVAELKNLPINQVYDTNKFWRIPLNFGTFGQGAVLSFTSALSGTITVVVTKSKVTGYDYTVAETIQYNPKFNADGLDENALVSDYLIDVHIYKSNLLNAALSVNNAIVSGSVNLDVLDQINADAAAKYYATYQGSIGNVIDLNGNNLSVVNLINADFSAHGCYAAVNMDKFIEDGVDLACRNAFVFDETGQNMPTVPVLNRLGYTIQPTLIPQQVKALVSNPREAFIIGNQGLTTKSAIADYAKTLRAQSIQFLGNQYDLGSKVPGTIDAPVMLNGQPFPKNVAGLPVYPPASPKAGQQLEVEAAPGTRILNYTTDRVQTQAAWEFNDGSADTLTGTINVQVEAEVNGATIVKTMPVTLTANVEEDLNEAILELLGEFMSGLTFAQIGAADSFQFTTTAVPVACAAFEVISVTYDGNEHTVSAVGSNPLVASNLEDLVSTPITLPVGYDEQALAEAYGTSVPVYKLLFSAPLANLTPDLETVNVLGTDYDVNNVDLVYFNDWAAGTTLAKANVLQGIVDLDTHYVNGTQARQNAILNKLNEAGIMNSFLDPTIFKCRYMVDTFKTYIEPNAKIQYARLAEYAKRFPVFVPMPFYTELVSSTNPNFKDALGQFQMDYVKQGRNPDQPSTNSFNFPNNYELGKWLFVYENSYYNDGFNTKVVPSTAAIAALFYSKHQGGRKVYDIVGGQDWPITTLGLTGPEFEAGITDRGAMESAGINVLQNYPTQGGQVTYQLRSSRTAFQVVNSAFNYPESLEKVLYISDAVEPVLDARLFKYNNSDARTEVLLFADNVCDELVSAGAISSFTNKCDLENNTEEIRKLGIIVLDTELFNEYGVRIALHRSTIRTQANSTANS